MKKSDYFIISLISLYIIFLPLSPSTKIEWLLTGIFLFIGLIYLFELSVDKEKMHEFIGNFKGILLDKFTIFFMIYILIMALSVFQADSKVNTVKEFARFAYYAFVYFLIRFRITHRSLQETIIKVYMGTAFILSAIGIYDFVRNYYGHKDIMYILNNARAKATLPHPNAYGAFLILAIFPAIMIALKSKGRERVVYAVLSVLLSINLALTFSRNAWLALAVGILLLTVIYSWKLIFLALIPLGYIAASPNILNRIKQFRETGLNEGRFRLWQVAFKVIKEKFFFGVGSGNFIVVYKDYVKKYPELKIVEAEALPPHNVYLKAFSELGVFGFAAFILMCLEMIRRVYKIKDRVGGLLGSFYSGYFISMLCFFMMNFVDDLFFTPKVTFYFMLFISLACSVKEEL